MEFGVGAMRSLLPKLGGLLLEEYKLPKDLKREIKGLMDELLFIQAVLEKVSNMPLDHLDPLVKIWANHVRDLSYAIEDNLDSFMVCGEGCEPTKPHTFLGFIKKTCRKATKLKTRREIANDIKDVKIQVREVKDRYDRYKDAICNPNTKTEVDPRLMALYNKVSDLVGIDEAIEEVMKILSYHTDIYNNKLKTVSIVGFGGLGKTTLAKVVYDKLNKKFDCGGFITVGQNPDTKKVLRDILLELDMGLYRAATTMDERQMIDQLQKFLAGKRYFLVIDDIWDIPTWETVKYAFVDSHPESRIIVTTRIVDVAAKVGGIYHMEPLSDENSKMLFYTRTCGGEGVSQENQPAEVTKKILKKCGGVPLAIITIASLLVGKRGSDWSKVYDAIGFGHEDNEVVHNTRKILSFSYYDLPSDLKTCLLYLSMFPEDYYIEKKSLIWRWIAEGFVLDKEGVGSFELGEIYFNKLVNKSMIRWIDPHDFEEVQGGCVVHDMVLDLMRTISNHVNFVTIHDIEQHGTRSRGKRSSIVRRFALHGQSAEYKSNIEMQHVRSFNAITCGVSRIPPLRSFKVLRVLVIEDCVFPEGHSLELLGKLVHLRYLGLVKTGVSKLPEGIGCDLKFLEILDVRGGLISELPWSVGELCNLRCLWADEGTVMKGNVGKLTCLEELQLHSVDKCPNFFMELGKLMELRVLDIYFDEMEQTTSKALVESLCNLRKIQSMTVRPDGESLVVLGDSLEDLAPSSHLHFFSMLRMIIPRVPSWINYLRVPLLSHLCLQVEVVDSRDIETLGRLPSLLYLILEIMERSCISYTFGSDEFHKLRWLITKKLEIGMEEGALPMLEMLVYNASAREKDVASLVPWNNCCPFLENVFCWLDCTNSGKVEVKAVEATLRQAARTHPNQVEFRIRRDNYDKKSGRLIDRLELILGGLDRPKEIDCTADKAEIRNMITSLETLLHEAAEPLVGRYGEQDIRGLVTKFKSLLHDDAGTCQEEVDDGDATSSGDNQEEGPNQP